MKRNYLLILCVCLGIIFLPMKSRGQLGNESPIPYFRYSATAGLGATLLYGDLERHPVGPAIYLNWNYFLTHGLSIGVEFQEGLLWGEDWVLTDGIRRRALNFYHAGIFGFNFQPIKFMQDDHLRRIEYRQSWARRAVNSIFVGAGMGLTYNLQWNRQRVVDVNDDVLPAHDGKDRGVSYIVTTHAGIELPLHSLKPDLLDSYIWNLVIRGQLGLALNDELDGYSGTYPGNDDRDVYGLLSIGINLRF